ncbi:hypothetical protein [Halococcoides cellulosivorans]|uniref:Uncharacterized protein n=1 Tax=Halococcoides cellulosivorans TaxID=1679096 RepID=A0A2R4X1J1_9EURY|nr:hypothetical protein [Halococcoides cellulosivorans]AWB27656.1 hypothetical protein HARCEL1_08005 [Halococcoides cellulosivorans]
MVSNTRLYGAAIAFASGGYSLWSASTAASMSASAWIMVVLGTIVLVHGAVLLTPASTRLGRASGPLMIGYAAIMLFNQALLGTGMMGGSDDMTDGMGMNGGMGDTAASTMGWDPGMVALAALMLASGLIMTRDVVDSGMGESDGGM